jgi:hypothetical protein
MSLRHSIVPVPVVPEDSPLLLLLVVHLLLHSELQPEPEGLGQNGSPQEQTQ